MSCFGLWGDSVSKDAIYYQMKGLLSEMPPEDRAEIEQACVEVMAIANRSELAMAGVGLACITLDREGKKVMN